MLSKEDLDAIQKIVQKTVNTTFLNGIDQVVMPVLDEILEKQDGLQNDVSQLRSIVEEDVKRHDYFSEKITDHEKRITKLEHQF